MAEVFGALLPTFILIALGYGARAVNIASAEQFGMVNRFGYFMGAAFQVQDDLLNLTGKEGKIGKEILGDLLEGKRTLMLIHLLNHCRPSEKRELLQFLSLPRTARTQARAEWVCELMQKKGSIDAARVQAKFLAGAAMKEFYTVFGGLPDSTDKAFLEELVLYMIQRDY